MSNINSAILERLQERARKEGYSINTLLTHWLNTPVTYQDQLYYYLLANNARDIIYRIRLVPEMRFEYVSPAVTTITGYTPEEHYEDPQLGYKLIHPDDRHLMQAAMQQAGSDPIVLRWVRKDGSVIWTEQKNTLIFDGNGTAIAIEGIARDITENKRTEEKLRESEARWRSLTQHSPDHVMMLDKVLKIQFVNYASPGLSIDDLIGVPLYTFVQPERQAEVKAILKSVLATGEPATYETTYDSPEGKVYYETIAAPRYKDGDIIGITTSSRDVTARKHALEEARETNELLQTIIDHIPVMIAFFDENGRFQFVNHYWIERLGWTVEDLQQQDDPLTLFYPDPDYRQKALDYMMAAEPGWRDFRTRTKSGEVIDTTWANVRLSDGRSIGIGQDISERKHMEDALRESEERYKLLSDLAIEGIALHQQGVVKDANPAFLDMFGYERDEIIGHQMIDRLFTPESSERVRENIRKQSTHTYEVEGIRKDGTRFPIEVQARHVGSQLRVASLQDITERKQNEHMLLENERLRASFKKEEEQNALIQRIIAMLSHDLRTPLTVIQTSKDLLSKYADRLTEDQREEKLERIGRQIQFALELLEDTVLMARGNLGDKEFRPAPVNLATLCQVSVSEMSVVSDTQHHLRFVNVGKVEVVSIDEILVSRILLNLLSNAMKYSPGNSEIRLELDCNGDWVVLRVINQGMGISEKDLPHIFEPFYRPENVQHIHGTGLGLSIVKDCVDRHAGRVHVESELGQGATFIVELPTRPASGSGK